MKLIRKISTLMLTFCFIYLIISLLGLELSHVQRDLKNTGLLGQYAYIFKEVHIILGYFFMILLTFHTVINYKSIILHIKKTRDSLQPSKSAIAVTLISTALFAVITIVAINSEDARSSKKNEQGNYTNIVSQK